MALSYFAELLDAFAQEGEAEDAVYRLALAILAAVDGGTETVVLARYLEAWLLKLHGIYPPLDRCAGCDAPLPAGERRYHRLAHGFVCEACGPASGPVLDVTRPRLPARGLRPPARRRHARVRPRTPWRPSTATSSGRTSSATCARPACSGTWRARCADERARAGRG